MGTMIFVSSYFDYVRLRNYMKREGESFVQLHEYATNIKISRARGMFFGKEKKIIMMTERFHFYRHYVIRGVTSYLFYQLPLNPTFYHEIVNSSMAEGSKTVTRIIFNKFDAIRLRNTFGAENAKALLSAKQDFHVLASE
uniref:BPH_2 domain-containing protein n=1 Tax=Steinernema glaseri TaxID=37863 RepID=A0A1I7YQN2_9BILA